MLTIKIVLALSAAVTLGARDELKSHHVRFVHTSVFVHVVLIVILAKAIFCITW